jgi:hypothetical protein
MEASRVGIVMEVLLQDSMQLVGEVYHEQTG